MQQALKRKGGPITSRVGGKDSCRVEKRVHFAEPLWGVRVFLMENGGAGPMKWLCAYPICKGDVPAGNSLHMLSHANQ